jgi:hypothetical protein
MKTMAFLGNVAFSEKRSPSQTAALVMQRCFKGRKQGGEVTVEKFLESLSIKPEAFFRDIDADWLQRPFIGQHVFKVVQAAGYAGTENDLWESVTGSDAPYPIRPPLKSSARKAGAAATARTGYTSAQA